MPELRWLLLILGLVMVAGIYFYTKFKPHLERGMQAWAPRREPTLGNEVGVAETSPDEPDSASTENELTPAVIQPQSPASKIITIRLMARDLDGFPGDRLILTLRELGLKHGEFGIFHRPADEDDRSSEFSVASLVEPGSFDLKKLKVDLYPGVSIFMTLPGTRDGVEIFDAMLKTSRSLAKQLEGELVDEQGSSLSIQRERYLREEVIQFEHQGTS